MSVVEKGKDLLELDFGETSNTVEGSSQKKVQLAVICAMRG